LHNSDVPARPLFDRCRGKTGRDAGAPKSTLLTPTGLTLEA
jgi:hypothetical protein